MNAGFGAQQAESVLAFDFDGRAFDARHVTGRFVFDCSFETFAFGVFQILAQQHAGPVASFGATCAGLDVEEGVARVRLLAEHAAKFEVFDGFDQRQRVGLNGDETVVIAISLTHFEEFGVIGKRLG